VISSRQRARARLSTSQDRWKIDVPHSKFGNGYDQKGDSPAGRPDRVEEGDLGRLIMDLTPLGIPTNEKTFAVRVRGNSMTGAGINDGDTVIIEKREARAGDIVLALVNNEVTLKRLVREKRKNLLRAEHPGFPDIPLDRGSKIQGVAVGLIRRL
jgi:repressor LexA